MYFFLHFIITGIKILYKIHVYQNNLVCNVYFPCMLKENTQLQKETINYYYCIFLNHRNIESKQIPLHDYKCNLWFTSLQRLPQKRSYGRKMSQSHAVGIKMCRTASGVFLSFTLFGRACRA